MLTPEHLSQMRHAVGFYSNWKPGHRNYYCADKNDLIWPELVELGFATRELGKSSYAFQVTESGQKLIGLDEQIKLIKYMNEESFGVES